MHTFSGDQTCASLFYRAVDAGLALLFWHAFSIMNSEVLSWSIMVFIRGYEEREPEDNAHILWPPSTRCAVSLIS
jgi:hypothetical protein